MGASSYLTPAGDWPTEADTYAAWSRFWGFGGAGGVWATWEQPGIVATHWPAGSTQADAVWMGRPADVTPGDVVTVTLPVEVDSVGARGRVELLGSPTGDPNYFQPGTITVAASAWAAPPTDQDVVPVTLTATVPPGVNRLTVCLRASRGAATAPTGVRWHAVTSALNGRPDGPGIASGVELRVNGADRTGLAWAPLRVAWGRQHPGESLDPRRAVLTFDGAAAVQRGDVVTVDLNAPHTDPRWADAVGTWADQPGTWLTTRVQLRVFTGRITDTDTEWTPLVPRVSWEVTTAAVCIDPVGALNGLTVGDVPWAAETANERARRIADLTGLSWVLDPAGQRVAARDVDAQPALTLLDELASWVSVSGGVWFDPLDGLAYWLTDASRGSRDASVILPSSRFLDTAHLIESPDDLVNEFTVVHRSAADPSARPEEVRRNPSSSLRDGRRAGSRTTELLDAADAGDLAQSVVTRFGHVLPRWETVEVPLELVDAETAEKLLGLGPRARVKLTELPAPSLTDWSGYLEGYALDVAGPEVTDWTVTLTLSPAAWSGPLLTWAEVTPGKAWQAAVGTWQAATDSLTFT